MCRCARPNRHPCEAIYCTVGDLKRAPSLSNNLEVIPDETPCKCQDNLEPSLTHPRHFPRSGITRTWSL